VSSDPSNPTKPPRPSPAPGQPSLRPSPHPSARPSVAAHPSQPPRLMQSAAPDARELVRAARGDAPSAATRQASVEHVLRRYHRWRVWEPVAWAALGIGVGMAAAVALWLRANRAHETPLTRERPIASESAAIPQTPSPSPVQSSTRLLELEPCTPAVRAAGSQPMIDDFEDEDARIAPLEHRAGFWSASNDGSATQRPTPGGPLATSRIPGGRGASHFALHTSGGKFTKWGAILGADFSARRCYDASAYGGLRFWVRGRGSFNVAAKMTQTAPEEYGGSCSHDCFDSHRIAVPLSSNWREVRVTWAELKQRGFGQAVPFDPRSLLSLELSVDPEQTPFDFWVDDVSFLAR